MLGPRLAYASPSGGAVAAAPVGFSGAIGRLLVTLSADTTWLSLSPGIDGQLCEVRVVAGNFNLILSQAGFGGIDPVGTSLVLNNGVLIYYDATNHAWQTTSP